MVRIGGVSDTGGVTFEDAQAELAETIRSRREAGNKSQEDLAYESGLSGSQLALIEAGDGNPTLRTLCAIASALNVPLGSLLSAEVPRSPKKAR